MPIDVDKARPTRAITTLLISTLLICVAAVLSIDSISQQIEEILHASNDIVIASSLAIVAIGLLLLPRTGYLQKMSWLFIGIYSLVALRLTVERGFMQPAVLLLLIILIAVLGVVAGPVAGVSFALIAAIGISIVSWLEEFGYVHPDLSWLSQPAILEDGFGDGAVLLVFGVMTYFSNRHVNSSLQRALSSERAMQRDRDNLEATLHERSRQLQDAQIIHTMELQRLAEFGRLHANLLHDIANPLTAASLQLQMMTRQKTKQVIQAQQSIARLEKYVITARDNLQGQNEQTTFSVNQEIRELVRMLKPRLTRATITIKYTASKQYNLYGSPVKFSQIIGNLITNAIDACNDVSKTPAGLHPTIRISVYRQDSFIVCTVRDNGLGIPAEDMPKIFEPFFTTKQHSGSNMGIGLSIIRQFVETDFHGRIDVESTNGLGTIFTIYLDSGLTSTKL